jgi:hypothetical protein
VSFVTVRAAPGTDREALARALLARLAGTSVLTREAFVAANLREVSAGLLPLLGLLVTLGLAVAAVLVALLSQGLVEERRTTRVLLALGAGPHRVVGLSFAASPAWLPLAPQRAPPSPSCSPPPSTAGRRRWSCSRASTTSPVALPGGRRARPLSRWLACAAWTRWRPSAHDHARDGRRVPDAGP